MRNIVEESFSLNLFLLRCFGLIPFKHHQKLFRLYSLIIYVFLTLLLPILSVISFFTDQSADVTKITESAFITFECVTMIFKHIPFVVNGPKIARLFYELEKPIFSNNFKKRQQLFIDECVSTCRKITRVYLTGSFVAIIMYVTVPLLKQSGQTPISIWTPYGNEVGSPMFIASYIYVSITSTEAAHVSAAHDTLLAGVLYQMTCQVKILKDNLQYLEEDVELELKHYQDSSKKNILKNVLIYNRIQLCIIHHQYILDFINKYEKYLSFGLLMQCLGAGVVICISVFELTVVEQFSYSFFFVLEYLVTISFQMFVYSFFGTTLYEESKTICTAAYMSPWYTYDIKSQKALLLLMERANKPMIVAAGGIMPLSLDTFTQILKKAYSLYAVLTRYKD